jgi:hypothetical protein
MRDPQTPAAERPADRIPAAVAEHLAAAVDALLADRRDLRRRLSTALADEDAALRRLAELEDRWTDYENRLAAGLDAAAQA